MTLVVHIYPWRRAFDGDNFVLALTVAINIKGAFFHKLAYFHTVPGNGLDLGNCFDYHKLCSVAVQLINYECKVKVKRHGKNDVFFAMRFFVDIRNYFFTIHRYYSR